jgi:transcriptional regulator with XRE-family HTH domain
LASIRNSARTRFGALVRQRRLQRGLTIRQLAEEVGVKNPTISRLETGVTKTPRPALRVRLTQFLELDVFRARHSASRRGAHAQPGPRPTWWPAATRANARARIEEALQLLVQAHRESGGQLTPASMKVTFTANTELAWAVLALLRLDKRSLFDNDHPQRLVVAHVGTWALDANARWFFEQLGPLLPVGVGPHGGQATSLKATLRLERGVRRRRREYAALIDAEQKRAKEAQRRLRRARRMPDRSLAARERLVATVHAREARKAYRRHVKNLHAPVGSDTDRRLAAQLTQEIIDRVT